MVRATLSKHLSCHKTQIREPVLPQPELKLFDDITGAHHWFWKDCNWLDGGLGMPESAVEDYMPHKVGDILYVKETWAYSDGHSELPKGYYYQADEGSHVISHWRSSSAMPFDAARIFLRVTGVHVERLWEIEKYPFTYSDIPAGEIYHAKGYLREGLLHLLEPLVAEIFAYQTGFAPFEVRKMFAHSDYAYMLANVDYFITLPDGRTAILECKTSNSHAKEKWDNDAVPLNYELQVRHYMAVINVNVAFIACLYGNNENDFVWRRIERDMDFESFTAVIRKRWGGSIYPS